MNQPSSNVKLTYLKTQTADGCLFTGQLFQSPKKQSETVVLHIHGMGGNLYFNYFYPEMVRQYTKSGIDLALVEHRGSASVNGIYNAQEDKIVQLGDTYELFEDSLLDINAWVQKLLNLGYNNIILQAHSLGPSKIMHWYFGNQKGKQNIQALILLSPVDVIWLGQQDANYTKLLKEAKRHVNSGNPDHILSHLLWDEYLLSAATFISLLDKKSSANIFAYHDPNNKVWKKFAEVKIPVFIAAGSEDLFRDVERDLKMLKRALTNSPKVEVKVYKGAEHSFEGFEEELAGDIVRFLGKR